MGLDGVDGLMRGGAAMLPGVQRIVVIGDGLTDHAQRVGLCREGCIGQKRVEEDRQAVHRVVSGVAHLIDGEAGKLAGLQLAGQCGVVEFAEIVLGAEVHGLRATPQAVQKHREVGVAVLPFRCCRDGAGGGEAPDPVDFLLRQVEVRMSLGRLTAAMSRLPASRRRVVIPSNVV
ncbi:hypothetical protein D3867_15100 (plasmid) [Azospirillum argentinense]|uniref:Uncharacterized protein n=1 Tax=Azospirillum brasilense TaxID=192 RepID=A0A4D8Q6N1_AZOBR|nr:hypothetical protein D3867_15100 [Azospirillum argentinense]